MSETSREADTSAVPPRHTHGVLGRASRLRWEYETGGGQHDERPLAGYSLLLAGYAALTGTAVAVLARRRRGAALPGPLDLLLLAVATFRAARTLSRDAVTSPLRAPFTVFSGSAGEGQVLDSPRRGPVRHAVGELLTCPFCLGQWVATAALVSWAASPRATRWAAATLSLVAAADVLHHGQAALERSGS